MTKKTYIKLGLLTLIIAAVIIFFAKGGHEVVTLAAIKEQKDILLKQYNAQPGLFIWGYMVIYIATTALSLPGATVLTLAGGAVFGVVMGLAIVSFASTIGASCAFLVSRFLVGESLQRKYKDRLRTFNEGLEQEGSFYLFAMRLVPVVPFFLINLVMGLTKFPLWKFFVVSQIGMLPGTIAYVYAGSQLATITSVKDVLSLNLLVAFTVLGLLPLVLKKVLNVVRKYRS